LNNRNNQKKCFFCGRQLSNAKHVNYVAEGPICSLCLMGNKKKPKKDVHDQYSKYDQVLYG